MELARGVDVSRRARSRRNLIRRTDRRGDGAPTGRSSIIATRFGDRAGRCVAFRGSTTSTMTSSKLRTLRDANKYFERPRERRVLLGLA